MNSLDQSDNIDVQTITNTTDVHTNVQAATTKMLPPEDASASKGPGSGNVRQSDMRYRVDDVPPWYLCIFLGLQHYLTTIGPSATTMMLLYPALCLHQDRVELSEIMGTLFFVSGIITCLQTTIGVRLPIVQCTTLSFLVPTLVMLDLPQWKCPTLADDNMTSYAMQQIGDNQTGNVSSISDQELWVPRMLEVQGAIISASLLEVVVGATGAVGVVMKYIGPLTIAPTITLIGIALFDVAAKKCAEQWGISMLTIVLITVFSQYLQGIEIPMFFPERQVTPAGKRLVVKKKGYRIFLMFPVILAILLVWLLCYILTVSGAFRNDPDAMGYKARTDLHSDVISKAYWFRLPYPFQWGLPTFSVAGTLGMLTGVMAGMVESVGDYHACAKLADAPPPPVHAINRGIMIEGIGCVLAGMFGTGNGTTSHSSNVGAVGLTKVGSRRVIQVTGLIMIFLGIFAKFGALFITIPNAIVGGIFMVVFGMVIAVGLSNLQYVDLNSTRNLFIVGFSILFGLSLPKWLASNPDVINTGVGVLDQIISVLLGTSMFLGGSLACILDNTIAGSPEERGMTSWTTQSQVADQSDQTDQALTTYDVPYINSYLSTLSWTKHTPICPAFKNYGCNNSSSCRGRRLRKGSDFDKVSTSV